LSLDFHFDDLLDDFWRSSDAFIYAGFNAMNTLRTTIPNGIP